MAKIAGLRIKNFRSLRDVTLGRLWNQQQAEPLTTIFNEVSDEQIKQVEERPCA